MRCGVDFSQITPCGGSCAGCDFYNRQECAGCRNNGGKCVKMWENGCAIFACCERHGAYFCGACEDFPCEWLKAKISEWDKDGIENLSRLAAQYIMEEENGQA